MEAYTVGVIVTFYDKFVVLEAFGLTAAVTVALTGECGNATFQKHECTSIDPSSSRSIPFSFFSVHPAIEAGLFWLGSWSVRLLVDYHHRWISTGVHLDLGIYLALCHAF